MGVDKEFFNMPLEVVFVDTPGLKDPVKYRSNITRNYIKKADAVLIAVPTAALTTEGNEIITTVLDCTDEKKAYIVATQTDRCDNDEACENIISLWVKQLVDAKRYPNERSARNRIIRTSAKMEILTANWIRLSDEERADEEMFSYEDYSALESYTKKIVRNRGYDISRLPYDEESRDLIVKNAGISTLRSKLRKNLINQYRELKIADIEEAYLRCKKQLNNICKRDIKQQQEAIKLAEQGAEALKMQIEMLSAEKQSLQQESDDIRNAADKLKDEISRAIVSLERKGGQ